MKLLYTLHNQKGSALFEVVASMAILLIVITGMMMTISYARYKSVSNYHHRIALLKAESELQIVKMKHYTTRTFPAMADYTFQIKTEKNAKPINARLDLSAKTVSDPTVSLKAYYVAISASVTWKEPPPIFSIYTIGGKSCSVVVREDYFFERP
jgi:hypothetical protein